MIMHLIQNISIIYLLIITFHGFISQVDATTNKKTRVKRQLYDPKNPISSISINLAPKKVVDVVVLLGRYRSIGKRLFYGTGRPLLLSILKQYPSIQRDNARVAVLTFGREYSVDYDDISIPSYPKNKCELFPPDSGSPQPLDSVVYKDIEEQGGCSIQGALNKASEIFYKGKSFRPAALQVLILMMDGNFIGCNFVAEKMPEISKLKLQGIIIYGIGYGQSVNMKESTLKEMVSTYQGDVLYGSSSLWNTTLSTPNPAIPKTVPILDPVSGRDPCTLNPSDVNALHSTCYCDVDFGYYRRLCDKGFYYDVTTNICQACPLNTYKPSIGKGNCFKCYPNYYTKNTASTSLSDCLPTDQSITKYMDPCVNNPCSSNANRLCAPEFQGLSLMGFNCSQCISGFDPSKYCVESVDDCRLNNVICSNGGKCVDGWDDYSCSCPNGFYGKLCQNKLDDCRFPNLCGSYGRCRVSSSYEGQFFCQCNSPYEGDLCDINSQLFLPHPITNVLVYITESPIIITTTLETKRNSEVPVEINDHLSTPNPLVGIVVPAVLVPVILIALIIGIILCVYYYRKKRNDNKFRANLITPIYESPYNTSNPLVYEQTGASYGTNASNYNSYDKNTGNVNSFYEMSSKTSSSTLDKRLFNRVSKLCDTETIKEGKMMSGVPKAPSDVSITGEDINLNPSSSPPSQNLSEWKTLLTNLVSKSGLISNGLIADVHRNKFVTSEGWNDLNWDEILYLDTAIENEKVIQMRGTGYTLGVPKNRTVIGKKLELLDNISEAGNDDNNEKLNEDRILALGRSKNYLLVVVGDDEKMGNKLVQSLIAHIVREGH